MKTAIRAELPPDLLAQAKAFIDRGEMKDLDELLAEALRRYLESHSTAMTEGFIREDVKWGLHGSD